MALVSNIGLGSGLDISSLVTQLVNAERAAPSAALNRREARTKAQISAIGQVKSAFAQLQTAVNTLQSGAPFEARKVTSAEVDRLTATIRAGQTPALGNYSIEIESLASAQKLQSDPTLITDAADTLATGTLQFTVDGSSFEVAVEAGSTLYDFAESINSAAQGKLQAAVVRGDDGYTLSLTSGVTGSSGEISISQTDGNSLAAFTYDPNAPLPGTLSETSAAADAVLYVDGVKRTASSNVLTDVVNGLELNLKQAELGVSFNLTVSEDSSGAQAAVQSFVSAYNNSLKVLAEVSAFDPEAKTSAALNGDGFVRSATAQLRNFVGAAFRAAADAGVELGIDTAVDGSLSLDGSAFSQALAADPNALKALYSGESASLSSGLASYLSGVLGDDGLLTQRSSGLNAELGEVSRDREALERRLVGIEQRYRKQFVALDSLLANLNNTSQYLAQQLQGLSGSSG